MSSPDDPDHERPGSYDRDRRPGTARGARAPRAFRRGAGYPAASRRLHDGREDTGPIRIRRESAAEALAAPPVDVIPEAPRAGVLAGVAWLALPVAEVDVDRGEDLLLVTC